MGPLMPFEIVSMEWGLIIIFLIGLSFGIILEQSGFSSSKKLVGVFYAYDFVVLKVFFTAGITAMTGIFFLEYFGWIDTGFIFINSNFLSSAIIGGVIMGFGFLIGGFCPGTSISAAAIGKIDAIVFVIGIFIGILLFGIFFNQFNLLQSGIYFERVIISDLIGISKNLFIAIMILTALIAFMVAAYFENKASPNLKPTNKGYQGLIPEALIAITIIIILLAIPTQNPKTIKDKHEKELLTEMLEKKFLVNSDELAYHFVQAPLNFKIIDVRERPEFINFHFPEAVNIPLRYLSDKRVIRELRRDRDKRILLVSNGGLMAVKAWQICQRSNIKNVYVLNGGLNAFINDIFYDNTDDSEITDYIETSKYRFRKEAADYFRNN